MQPTGGSAATAVQPKMGGQKLIARETTQLAKKKPESSSKPEPGSKSKLMDRKEIKYWVSWANKYVKEAGGKATQQSILKKIQEQMKIEGIKLQKADEEAIKEEIDRKYFKKEQESSKQENTKSEQGATEEVTVTYRTEKLKQAIEGEQSYKAKVETVSTSGMNYGTPQQGGLKHAHVGNDTAICWKWKTPTKVEVVATGVKSTGAINGTGGYDWDEQGKNIR
jgi:hypothetical protein